MISIVTPSFNRCHTLDRLWSSLCEQTGTDEFEWLLVDDGSTDGTRDWFYNLKPNPRFQARYVYQANQGKHIAINTAASHAHGDWVLILDSDDAITPDAIQTIIDTLSQLRHDDRLVGICFRKQFFGGELVGQVVDSQSPISLTPNQAGLRFKGDLAYVIHVNALLKHPFPVISGENFVPEQLVWNRISDDGRIYYHPSKAIYLCEYLPDGYTRNFKRVLKQNPLGFGLFYHDQRNRLEIGWPWLKASLRWIQCRVYRFFTRRKEN